jgi:hypothetical protein
MTNGLRVDCNIDLLGKLTTMAQTENHRRSLRDRKSPRAKTQVLTVTSCLDCQNPLVPSPGERLPWRYLCSLCRADRVQAKLATTITTAQKDAA